MASILLENGVADYPISKDMSLTGIWNYIPNSKGPVIAAKQDALDISRSQPGAYNQWTMLSIQHQLQAQGGAVMVFDIKYDSIHSATEVKLTLACGMILRYDGKALYYCWWDNGFHDLKQSTIKIGDGNFYKVTMCISPDTIYIFENGDQIGVWNTKTSSPFQPMFDWQILESDATLQATLSNIMVMPPLFVLSVKTLWDIVFANERETLAQWEITKQKDDPIPITFPEDGYMRAATSKLSTYNSWVYTQGKSQVPSVGVLMYRMRVNESGGSETKITIFGQYILRITKSGQQVEWDLYTNGGFVKQADSSIMVGNPAWTVVMLVYSQKSVTLFENGVAMFSQKWSSTPSLTPVFHVQHLDTNTAVSVDLSHVRCLPKA
ncbi:MAG: hypothetical protein M1834_003681 [Cirrosporium novae-zelandiae]|nr:MAG: hypothetical protein M1834_003681 [Cirrosporium novae-zelandiae]